MASIATKHHIFKFYVTLAFLFLFLMALSLGAFFIFISELDEPLSIAGRSVFFLMGLFGVFFSFYSVIKYARNSPKVTVDETQISFNNETFLWKDLVDIELTGKQPFKYMKTFPMEGIMFQFKDGTVKYVFDDVYSNLHDIKYYIQTVVIEKQNQKALWNTNKRMENLKLDGAVVFKGNQFTSGRGISLWGVIFFFLVLLLINYYKYGSTGGFMAFMLLGGGWFLFHSAMMNYIVVTDSHLHIKNHNFPWRDKLFPLDNIKEIVFESSGNRPNCIRIISKNFQDKLYLASTLRNKTWLELEKKLNEKGIIVRNECIHP